MKTGRRLEGPWVAEEIRTNRRRAGSGSWHLLPQINVLGSTATAAASLLLLLLPWLALHVEEPPIILKPNFDQFSGVFLFQVASTGNAGEERDMS